MKYAAVTILLIMWLLVTIVLCATLIGVIAVLTDEYLEIPSKLLKVFEQ